MLIEVSDTTIAMILSLGRNIGKYNNKAKELIKEPNIENPWQENTDFSSIRFKEISGLIGVGRIGSSVALKMKNIVGNLIFMILMFLQDTKKFLEQIDLILSRICWKILK